MQACGCIDYTESSKQIPETAAWPKTSKRKRGFSASRISQKVIWDFMTIMRVNTALEGCFPAFTKQQPTK